MRRFFVRPEDVDPTALRLTGAEALHLGRVLRLQAGAYITAFDGVGHEYAAVVDALAGDTVHCRILQTRTSAPAERLSIILGQGMPKAEKFEWVIQKATELGVAGIVPLMTEHSVPHIAPQNVAKKLSRWERIAREACKQCGRSVIPSLWPPTSVPDFYAMFQESDLKLVVWEGERTRSLGPTLATTAAIASVAVVIGPEGGLAPSEVAAGESFGFLPVGLGLRILRTETASLVAVALLQYRFGDLG
jgi:16S rRNA (uracil1498-N3)-methyltransferase